MVLVGRTDVIAIEQILTGNIFWGGLCSVNCEKHPFVCTYVCIKPIPPNLHAAKIGAEKILQFWRRNSRLYIVLAPLIEWNNLFGLVVDKGALMEKIKILFFIWRQQLFPNYYFAQIIFF
jgi:hypothetical protein